MVSEDEMFRAHFNYRREGFWHDWVNVQRERIVTKGGVQTKVEFTNPGRVLLFVTYHGISFHLKTNPARRWDSRIETETRKLRETKTVNLLTFQTRKVVGLRLDCTDREFSRQYVEDAMYANKRSAVVGATTKTTTMEVR